MGAEWILAGLILNFLLQLYILVKLQRAMELFSKSEPPAAPEPPEPPEPPVSPVSDTPEPVRGDPLRRTPNPPAPSGPFYSLLDNDESR